MFLRWNAALLAVIGKEQGAREMRSRKPLYCLVDVGLASKCQWTRAVLVMIVVLNQNNFARAGRPSDDEKETDE